MFFDFVVFICNAELDFLGHPDVALERVEGYFVPPVVDSVYIPGRSENMTHLLGALYWSYLAS